MNVTAFWHENRQLLQNNYPGLTLARLKSEAVSFGHRANFFKQVRGGVPLEYITGKAYFYKSEFAISRGVFIPRFETEILVEKAVKLCRVKWRKTSNLKVCDVGCGLGAIVLSLCRELPFAVDACAIDISEEALNMARQNHSLLKKSMHQQTHICFLKGDRLTPLNGEKQHLIVSNPPYIKKRAGKSKVHPQVLQYEPRQALFLDDKTYFCWFREFFGETLKTLYASGEFFMEGDEEHLPLLADLAESSGFKSVSLHPDYNRQNRFLHATKP